jgi:hypothetical protein
MSVTAAGFSRFIGFLALASACSCSGSTAVDGGVDSGGDGASGSDAGAAGNPGLEASTTDATPDGAPAATCAPGASSACSALAGSFTAGNAACRPDGTGWDVTGCTLASNGQLETVKPAEREPAAFATAR